MKKNKERRSVVGYVRVSSQEQADEGISLSAQRQKIKQWAELHDNSILGIYSDEGVSGTRTNRIGLQKALEMACTNKSIFVVYSLSRFSRSTTDTLKFTTQLQKAGAELVSISEQIDTLSAAGKMIFRVLAVLNEFESDLGGERTKAALDYRRAKGLKTGGFTPYGYKVDKDKRLHFEPKEQQIIERIKAMRARGTNYHAIAKQLNNEGIKTKTGKKWYGNVIKGIIERPCAIEPQQSDMG